MLMGEEPGEGMGKEEGSTLGRQRRSRCAVTRGLEARCVGPRAPRALRKDKDTM